MTGNRLLPPLSHRRTGVFKTLPLSENSEPQGKAEDFLTFPIHQQHITMKIRNIGDLISSLHLPETSRHLLKLMEQVRLENTQKQAYCVRDAVIWYSDTKNGRTGRIFHQETQMPVIV